MGIARKAFKKPLSAVKPATWGSPRSQRAQELQILLILAAPTGMLVPVELQLFAFPRPGHGPTHALLTVVSPGVG